MTTYARVDISNDIIFNTDPPTIIRDLIKSLDDYCPDQHLRPYAPTAHGQRTR